MSLARQTVVRGPSLTGLGERPVRQPSHHALLLMGKMARICGRRKKPEVGLLENIKNAPFAIIGPQDNKKRFLGHRGNKEALWLAAKEAPGFPANRGNMNFFMSRVAVKNIPVQSKKEKALTFSQAPGKGYSFPIRTTARNALILPCTAKAAAARAASLGRRNFG